MSVRRSSTLLDEMRRHSRKSAETLASCIASWPSAKSSRSVRAARLGKKLGQRLGLGTIFSRVLSNFSRDDAYLVDIVLNFIIAGRDTTASTLSWSTYELAEHPAEADALRQEADEVLGGRVPTFDDIFQRMPKLRAFLNEVLRLHPPPLRCICA